jgi:hypothetical protein
MVQACRPAGRLFYLALMVVMMTSGLLATEGAASEEETVVSSTAKPSVTGTSPRPAPPIPQSGPALTSVIDTVYMADGSGAQGTLVITWPAFTTASGTAVAPGSLDVTLGTNGALDVALVPNAKNKPGADKKDAAMSFLQNALAMTDAVAEREIINPVKFREGISQIIDGTVECLNASTWCKQPPASKTPPAA